MDHIKKKILIVDDEETIRFMFKKYLSLKGFDVEEANSGQKALELVPKYQPEIILLDVQMPEMDGLETLKRLKKNFPGSEVIMTTAVRDEEIFKKCNDLGAVYYILKPVEFECLDAIIFGKILHK